MGHTDLDKQYYDYARNAEADFMHQLVKNTGLGFKIETDGLGESKPIAPNDTSTKALNKESRIY